MIGASVEQGANIEGLHAVWLGFVRVRERKSRQLKEIDTVLERLRERGLVTRIDLERPDRPDTVVAYEYHLTERGLKYYYAGFKYGGDPLRLPYLCYSTLEPRELQWARVTKQPPHDVLEASFAWRVDEFAAWGNDGVLRSHSVILPPTASPSVIAFLRSRGEWRLERTIRPANDLPQLANSRAWSRDI